MIIFILLIMLITLGVFGAYLIVTQDIKNQKIIFALNAVNRLIDSNHIIFGTI